MISEQLLRGKERLHCRQVTSASVQMVLAELSQRSLLFCCCYWFCPNVDQSHPVPPNQPAQLQVQLREEQQQQSSGTGRAPLAASLSLKTSGSSSDIGDMM